jgi:LAO/AO transport system kinase
MGEPSAIVEGVLAGDRRAVARAISLVERDAPELPELSGALFPHTGRATTVGFTGAPGVGKSTLVTAIVGVARNAGMRVAVLAIDPTSPYTGGALLGDRVRMQKHDLDEEVFVRSMATRGHLGGMALAAPEAIRILDAAGFDLIVVETVGVGQAEVEVAAATDTVVVVLAPGLGDAVQMAKAGILEIADIFVVNKADRPGAGQVVRELGRMLDLGAHEPRAKIIQTIAPSGDGIEEVWGVIETRRVPEASAATNDRRHERLLREVKELATAEVRRQIEVLMADSVDLAGRLLRGEIDPRTAARELRAHLPLGDRTSR